MAECSLSTIDGLSLGSITQRQIEKGYFKEIKPINPVKESNVIEFLVSGDGEEFSDLVHTYLKMTIKLKKNDGTDLVAADKATVINYIGATLFSQIDILLNDVQISSSTPNNAYRAILEALLTYDTHSLESQMQAGGFYKDEAGKMDELDPDGENQGLKERFKLLQNGKSCEFVARIHTDLFTQPKLLVNGVRMRLKLQKNKDSFCLLSAADSYRLEIEDISLMIRKCKLADDVYAQTIQSRALYPITRVLMKDYSFTQGVQSISMNNIVHGILPQRIVLAMVSNAAMNGSTTMNPFNFQHFNLSECNVLLNGSSVNGKAMTFDFENSKYLDGYWSLFSSTGKMHDNAGSVINRKDYKNGYALIVFDLSPTLCNGDYIDPDNSGELSVSLSFKNNLTNAITVLLYLEYNSQIEITKEKEVVTHFHV